MSKRPTPKKQQANSQSSRRYKEFQNKARKKLMGKVEYVKKLQNNKNFLRVKEESAGKETEKITRVKA